MFKRKWCAAVISVVSLTFGSTMLFADKADDAIAAYAAKKDKVVSSIVQALVVNLDRTSLEKIRQKSPEIVSDRYIPADFLTKVIFKFEPDPNHLAEYDFLGFLFASGISFPENFPTTLPLSSWNKVSAAFGTFTNATEPGHKSEFETDSDFLARNKKWKTLDTLVFTTTITDIPVDLHLDTYNLNEGFFPLRFPSDQTDIIPSGAEVRDFEKVDIRYYLPKESARVFRDSGFAKWTGSISLKSESRGHYVLQDIFVRNGTADITGGFVAFRVYEQRLPENKVLVIERFSKEKNLLLNATSIKDSRTVIPVKTEGEFTLALGSSSGPFLWKKSVSLATQIGDIGPAGGLIFYDLGSSAKDGRFLESAPFAQTTEYFRSPTVVSWANVSGKLITRALNTQIGFGKPNTQAIVTSLGSGNYAASLCQNFQFAGYSDWFLPSKEELKQLGIVYAAKGLYKNATSQTYWTSSQADATTAWSQTLSGTPYKEKTDSKRMVRAIHAFNATGLDELQPLSQNDGGDNIQPSTMNQNAVGATQTGEKGIGLPDGVAIVGDNLYITSPSWHRIFRVNSKTGIATVVVGTGARGNANGPGTKATLNFPTGITTDGKNLYVSELSARQVRKVSLETLQTSSVAGNPQSFPGYDDGVGTAARFGGPRGLATDGSQIYVVDSENSIIRSIEIATGTVSTLAGSSGLLGFGDRDGQGTSARFNKPLDVTIVGGKLFVVDTKNNKIRQIVLATGEVTTFAGSGKQGSANGQGTLATFNSPEGITNDGTNLYVADQGNNLIRKIEIATGQVTTLAGSGDSDNVNGIGSKASFASPVGVATDGTDLYVADYKNGSIRRVVLATGEVSTIVSSPLARPH